MTTVEHKEIKFPSVVVFKGDNNAYLKVWTYNANRWDQTAFLRFCGAKHENEAKFEVINQADGYVAIRSLHNGKYWNGNPGSWIRANGNIVDQYALFMPVIFPDNKVAFIYKPTKCYVKRLTTDGWESLLSAQKNYIDDWSYLTVEEPVISRSITNVVYDLSSKKITSIEPMVLDEQVVQNNTTLTNDFTVNYSHSYTKSTSFNRGVSFTAEVSTTITAGVPALVGGEVTVSASVTSSLDWGTSKEESSTVSGSVTVGSIPPGKRVKITISGEKATINVPFRYQQLDKLTDGTTRTTTLFDGVFTGMSQYFARYEAIEL
jgi:hypothetical protein